jgi:hypothetical protein
MAIGIPCARLLRHAAIAVGALFLAGSAWLIGGAWPPAIAHADPGQTDEFYTPPVQLPAGQPGQDIRQEPSRLVLEPSGVVPGWQANGTRIMYTSGGGPS